MWRHIDVQAECRRSLTYGRAPNAIDISKGVLTCPSKHRHGANLFTVIPRNRPISVAFYNAHGDTEDLFLSQVPRVPTGNWRYKNIFVVIKSEWWVFFSVGNRSLLVSSIILWMPPWEPRGLRKYVLRIPMHVVNGMATKMALNCFSIWLLLRSTWVDKKGSETNHTLENGVILSE